MSKLAFSGTLKSSRSIIAISIGAKDDPSPRLKSRRFAGYIRLEFQDLYEENMGLEVGTLPDHHEDYMRGARLTFHGYEVCDITDANKIVEFLNDYANKNEPFKLAVHCHAGVSRSSAVAQFCADHYGAKIEGFNNDTSCLNKRLLRLLEKVRSKENELEAVN